MVVLASLSPLLALSACGGETGHARAQFSACSLVDEATAAKATGAKTVTMADESKDLNGPPSNLLSCRYTADSKGPALVFLATQVTNPDKARSDATATPSACEDATPLALTDVLGYSCPTRQATNGPQVSATWDGYFVQAWLTTSRKGPTGQEAVGGLTRVVEKLHDTLKTSSFEQRLRTAVSN